MEMTEAFYHVIRALFLSLVFALGVLLGRRESRRAKDKEDEQ